MTQAKSRLSIAGTVVLSTLVLGALFATLHAEPQPEGQESVQSGVSVKTVGSTKSKVTLKLTFDNGAVFTVTQLVGKPIKVEHDGSAFAIVAELDNDGTANQVKIKIFKMLSTEGSGNSLGEAIGEMRFLGVGKHAEELVQSNLGFRVHLIKLSLETDVEKNIELSSIRLMDGGEECSCCVTCSGVRVCGCAVDAGCGSCCCGVCCGGFLG